MTGTAWKMFRDWGRTSPDDVLDYYGIVEPSIDVEAIARALGAKIEYSFDGRLPGSIDSTQEVPVITLRAGDYRPRQRFTIAHEIGHLLLHPLGLMNREGFHKKGDPRETEANRFAADLLMPEWMLDLGLEESKGNINRMAEMFGVSSEAMYIRLSNTGRL